MLKTLTRALLTVAILAAAGPMAQAQTATGAPAAMAASAGDDTLLRAREALKTRDRARLAAARNELVTARHPLALWADYWELGNRLDLAQQPELEAFYARWPGSYVEDRLRNDWLLELGRRRDWANFRTEFPRFRMNDDREVSCYALLTRHLEGQDVPELRQSALAAWSTQRDGDDGCPLLGSTLVQAKLLNADDAWRVARVAADANRPRSARAAAALAVTPPNAKATDAAVADLWRDPARFLNHKATLGLHRELAVLALMRLAAADPEAAATRLETTWQAQLAPVQAATAWAQVAKQAALKQLPLAAAYADRAWALRISAQRTGHEPHWSDDALAWQVRAALRLPARDPARWTAVARAIAAMGPTEQRDPAWIYWRARANEALARPGPEGDAARAEARAAMQSLALPGASNGAQGAMGFYAKLAAEELGPRPALPPAPLPLTAAELQAARNHPGLARGLQLIALGLRSEGVREWNFSLRGLADRELLAAAQTACEREVWDRCINTSERTRGEIDFAQRFPTPHRDAVRARATEIGIDPAFVYGLIRQESRFVMDTRSHVGATGLMQLMPATARWTARKIGMDFRPEQIADRDINLRLGASYLKMVLDDFGGSQALAAAAYNAGPGRPRRWREGPPVEPAAWAESIPFNETRDYVKRVLSNAVDYAMVMGADIAASGAAAGPASSIKRRLGPPIGPRDPAAPSADAQMPSAY